MITVPRHSATSRTPFLTTAVMTYFATCGSADRTRIEMSFAAFPPGAPESRRLVKVQGRSAAPAPSSSDAVTSAAATAATAPAATTASTRTDAIISDVPVQVPRRPH